MSCVQLFDSNVFFNEIADLIFEMEFFSKLNKSKLALKLHLRNKYTKTVMFDLKFQRKFYNNTRMRFLSPGRIGLRLRQLNYTKF